LPYSKWDEGTVDNVQMLIANSAALFALGLLGVIVRQRTRRADAHEPMPNGGTWLRDLRAAKRSASGRCSSFWSSCRHRRNRDRDPHRSAARAPQDVLDLNALTIPKG
jgi:hypothetical protein